MGKLKDHLIQLEELDTTEIAREEEMIRQADYLLDAENAFISDFTDLQDYEEKVI